MSFNALASAANDKEGLNVMMTLRDSIVGLGLVPEDPCDPTSLQNVFSELINDFADEVVDVVDNIAVKIGGNFIVSSLILVGTLIGGTALAWMDSIVGEFAYGAMLGGLTTIATSVLALIPGASIILQYYAISVLRIQLEYRHVLSGLLKRDIQQIILVFESFESIFKYDATKHIDEEIIRALQQVKKAKLATGVEHSRIENGSTLRVYNVKQAEKHVEKAINYLTSGSFSAATQVLDTVKRQYGLKTEMPTNPADIIGWTTYFTDLNKELSHVSIDVYKNILMRLIPVLPKIFQVLMMQKAFTQASNNLLEKFPVFISQIKGLFNVKKRIDNAFVINDNFVKKAFGYSGSTVLHPFYTDPDTKDLTVRDLNTKVKIYETVLLLFPSMWGMIQEAGGLYGNILKTILDDLRDVELDMTAYMDEEDHTTFQKLAKKAEWSWDLTSAKGKMKTITGNTSGFPVPGTNLSVNGAEIANLLEEAQLSIDALKMFISEKYHQEQTETTEGGIKEEPAEVAYNLAQKTLAPLMANIAVVLSPGSLKKIKADLKSIEILLTAQQNLDREELRLCSRAMSTIESHPAFAKLNLILEKFLSSLDQTPIAGLAQQIANGDISGLVAGIQNMEAMSDMYNMYNCTADNSKSAWYIDSVLDALSFDPTESMPSTKDAARVQKQVTKAMNNLKDKQQILENQFNQMQDYTERLGKENQNVQATEEEEINVESNVSLAYIEDKELQEILEDTLDEGEIA